MEHKKSNHSLPLMEMEPSSYSLNKCVYENSQKNIWLYQSNCLHFMDKVFEKYPEGRFDMIFADPPYFLSNDGISCYAGKMVKANKGDWDKSKGAEVNHTFNYQLMRQENNGKQMKTVWPIKPPLKSEKEFGKHPTQKPIQLLERIILASTNENDLIFDPFAGSSTTGVAAIKNRRQFVGCELEANFIDLSIKRLDSAVSQEIISLAIRENIK